MAIQITNEMREAALQEARRRNPYIRHHFELQYMTGTERDIIGFVGEFACKTLFNIPWQSDIRENYIQIDSGDIIFPGLAIDIKTETIPKNTLLRLVRGQVSDDAPYGRRLINQGQIGLLNRYDYVIWGAIPREMPDSWFSLGYISTSYILENYRTPVVDTPFGGRYPEACLNIKHSELRNVHGLQRIIDAHR